jgi:hypothetical protein
VGYTKEGLGPPNFGVREGVKLLRNVRGRNFRREIEVGKR